MKEKSTIVLVDDERNILSSLGLALEAEGYKVRSYSDGAAALEALTEEAAENVAESLTRGMRVMVSGRLRQRSFETREGEKRTVVELEVDEVGPSLRYATAKVNKVNRGGGCGLGFGADWRRSAAD